MPETSLLLRPMPTRAQRTAYTPKTRDDWADAAPRIIQGALDRTAGGYAGVALIADTEPTTPATGQVWLDTSATGSAGLGILAVTTITGDTTLTGAHTVVLCNATSGAMTVTLPPAASNSGRLYLPTKIDSSANPVTIIDDDGDVIAVLTVEEESIILICDADDDPLGGLNWRIF